MSGFCIGRPPSRCGLLDCVQVGHQIRSCPASRLTSSAASLLDHLPAVVRVEELLVGGDDISAYCGFLIPKRRLQSVGRDACRLDVVDQFTRHGVGASHQQRPGHQTGHDHHSHRGQHQVLPALHGEPPTMQPHPGDRSTRTTAMSSVSPPWVCARCAASSMSASTNAGTGQIRKRARQFEQPVLAEAFVATPRVPFEKSVGQQDQPGALGPFHLVILPIAGSQPQRWAAGRLQPVHRALAVHQHPRMPRANRAEPRPLGRNGEAQHRREYALARAFGRAGSARVPASGRGHAVPRTSSARQAMRSATPSAASSGPWPATSPIMTCTVRSGVCTKS